MTSKYNLKEVDDPNHKGDVFTLELLEEPFSGKLIQFGGVRIEEDDGQAILHFEYDVINEADSPVADKNAMNKYLGDLLVEMIEEGIKNNSLVYKGGIDDDRNNNSEQPNL